MDDILNLYKVTLRGMKYSSIGIIYGISYVIAHNPDEAYKTVRNQLDKEGTGFSKDRALESVELLAEGTNYPECRIKLYIVN